MRKLIRDTLLFVLGNFSTIKPSVNIINSHYVSPHKTIDEHKIIFENYIKYLINTTKLVSLEEIITSYIFNKRKNDTPIVSLTFDDGFEECYTIIAPLLEKYNIRGAFFINANYIESDKFYQKEFNARIHLHSKRPMNWDQIKDLHKRGHLIGSHTLDHYNLHDLSLEDIEYQIKTNKSILEKKLKYKCEYFAWPYGTLNDFPEKAINIVQKYHPYIFSSANYKKYFSLNGRVINRRHIEPFWPKSHIKYFLSANKI